MSIPSRAYWCRSKSNLSNIPWAGQLPLFHLAAAQAHTCRIVAQRPTRCCISTRPGATAVAHPRLYRGPCPWDAPPRVPLDASLISAEDFQTLQQLPYQFNAVIQDDILHAALRRSAGLPWGKAAGSKWLAATSPAEQHLWSARLTVALARPLDIATLLQCDSLMAECELAGVPYLPSPGGSRLRPVRDGQFRNGFYQVSEAGCGPLLRWLDVYGLAHRLVAWRMDEDLDQKAPLPSNPDEALAQYQTQRCMYVLAIA